MVTLRDYQQTLIDQTQARHAAGVKRLLIQLPTGGGKGVILPRLAKLRVLAGRTVIITAHRAELIDQICAALDREDMIYGRIQPGYPLMSASLQVGMVQTISRRIGKLKAKFPHVDDVMIDEAHHTPAGQYGAMTEAWPDADVTGLTATPVRTDGQGLSDYFDEMIQGPTTSELISRGFLADYDYYAPSIDFSADGIGKRYGDFKQADALKAIHKSKIVGDAVEHYRRYLNGRPAIVFCMGVEHTHEVAEDFYRAGIRAAGVDGKMLMSLRKERLAALASGALQVVTAADVISEGVDIPAVAGVVMLRPTASLSLYLQQVGRGLRLKPDGSKAIILDHVGNAKRHGLPADPRVWSLDSVKIDKTCTRTCERCKRVFDSKNARDIAAEQCQRAGNEVDPCPILTSQPNAAGDGKARETEIIAGNLEAVLNPWDWAGGIDPVLAGGLELKALIDKADSEERLRMVARARGYKTGWVRRILVERGQAMPNAWERRNGLKFRGQRAAQ